MPGRSEQETGETQFEGEDLKEAGQQALDGNDEAMKGSPQQWGLLSLHPEWVYGPNCQPGPTNDKCLQFPLEWAAGDRGQICLSHHSPPGSVPWRVYQHMAQLSAFSGPRGPFFPSAETPLNPAVMCMDCP